MCVFLQDYLKHLRHLGKLLIKVLKMFQINLQKDLFIKVAMPKWDMEFHIPVRRSERQKNAIVKSTSPTTQGKVLSSSIKDLSTNDSGNTLALKTFGPKQLAVSGGKTEVKKLFFFLDKLKSQETNDLDINLGVNGGQGFLKVTLSITLKPELENNETPEKLSKCDGYTCKDLKDSSVHKTIIQAICLNRTKNTIICG